MLPLMKWEGQGADLERGWGISTSAWLWPLGRGIWSSGRSPVRRYKVESHLHIDGI